MEKQDLKNLLENIYEAMILPTLGDEALSNPGLLNPPQQTPPTTPIDPDPAGPVPAMPLDNNGNPLFPSEKIWRMYYFMSRLGVVTDEFQRLRLEIYKWRLREAERRDRWQQQRQGLERSDPFWL